MLRYTSNYFLKSKHITPFFHKSFCKSNFSKDYIKDLKHNLTDFQNTFGFEESLIEKRQESYAKEKKTMRLLNIFGVVAFSIGKLIF